MSKQGLIDKVQYAFEIAGQIFQRWQWRTLRRLADYLGDAPPLRRTLRTLVFPTSAGKPRISPRRRVLVVTPASAELPRQKAVTAGLERLGYQMVPISFSASDLDCEFALCSGFKLRTQAARRFAETWRIPMIVAELGYMRRAHKAFDEEGYFQLGWNRIGWTPDEAGPERLAALELEIRDTIASPGGYTLVALQLPNDGQHGLSEAKLSEWLASEARRLAQSGPCEFVLRPHPRRPDALMQGIEFQAVQSPGSVSLTQSLAGASRVLTYNSTTGVDAMLQGVPVHAHASAVYDGYAVENLTTRMRFLERLAYAQWTLDELRSGTALEFLLSQPRHAGLAKQR